MEAKPKDFELSQSERIALMGLVSHPGWPVADELARRICRFFDAVSIAEENDEKATKLRYEARAAKTYSGLFKLIVEWNASCGKVTEKVKEMPNNAASSRR
jgi:hypothetical protein